MTFENLRNTSTLLRFPDQLTMLALPPTRTMRRSAN